MNTSTDVSPSQVAKWERSAAEANEGIRTARLMLGTGRDVLSGKSVDDHLMVAQELTEGIRSSARQVGGIHTAPIRGYASVSIDQLDTPDTRELLALLEQAQAVAERIDAARGRALPEDLPLQPGESHGTDLAESVSYLALRVRGEVCGPAGRD